jgi:diadenosine tetraphosphate (Ap4A) HIT family hydrolase
MEASNVTNGDGDVCEFCDIDAFRRADMCMENQHCLFASSPDPATGDDLLPGSGVIIPLAHRETPFDLTADEWTATRDLLLQAKLAIDQRLAPDGYTLIWNCYPAGGQAIPHAHFHVIPRFADEPYAGRGGRWLLKQANNRRPDPARPGLGAARRDR